jgi:hypothetical protein
MDVYLHSIPASSLPPWTSPSGGPDPVRRVSAAPRDLRRPDAASTATSGSRSRATKKPECRREARPDVRQEDRPEFRRVHREVVRLWPARASASIGQGQVSEI